MDSGSRTLAIACGALAREIVALKRLNGWQTLDIECLPPELHNYPDKIPDAVATAIASARARYSKIFVAYADCGTGGLLDAVLAKEGVERLPGAHCYEFFATSAIFAALHDAEPGTFYLTDFLVRHFERLVVEGLGLKTHPELTHQYFRNYRRIVYLAQTKNAELRAEAEAIATRFGFEFVYRLTDYGDLGTTLERVVHVPVSAVRRLPALAPGLLQNQPKESATWVR
jgi:hypothetical protein